MMRAMTKFLHNENAWPFRNEKFTPAPCKDCLEVGEGW